MSMSTNEEKFKIKLKKCKTLEDYRNLAKEYNIQQEDFSPEYKERILLKVARNMLEIN